MSPIFAATLHKLETGIPEREAPNTSSGKVGAAVRIPILLAKSCCVLTLGPVKLPPAPICMESPSDVLRSVAVLTYPVVPRPITVEPSCVAKKVVETKLAKLAVETRFAKLAVDTKPPILGILEI